MSAARHFFTLGTLTSDELKTDIKADITATRGAQRDLQNVGQHKVAADMGGAVDEHLDELNAAESGTWKPKHAR